LLWTPSSGHLEDGHHRNCDIRNDADHQLEWHKGRARPR
jgi:hypothetical protein